MDGIIGERALRHSLQHNDDIFKVKPSNVQIPKDKYLFCHVMFFLLGICHMLPMTFFAAANNFWMYKFRNTTDSDDSSKRTFLQTNFNSATLIATTIPSLLFGIFNITYGNRFKITSKIHLTLGVELAVFIIFAIFVKVNTDSFQKSFFAFVLLGYGVLAGANTVNMISSMNLFPRFPRQYMNTCLIGEGSAGIVSDILNILMVYICNDITKATLIYFIVGTVVVALTLAVNIAIVRTEFFKHSLESLPQNTEKKIPTRQEMRRILYKIRFTLSLFAVFFLGLSASHTSVTALVVSEQDRSSSSWAKNYFSPVMTFLLSDTAALIGRFLGSVRINLSDKFFIIFAVVATSILVPFIWLCNAVPKKHLPVLFPHDYQYGLIIGAYQISNGYLINKGTLLLSEKVEIHEADIAYSLMGFVINIYQTLCSPIGLFIVNVI